MAGRLAQLEERLVYTQEVGSSRLSPPTILLRMLRETGVMNIECPATMRRHVQKVLGGEYEVPYRATRLVILDIGANVGKLRGLGA